jgi:hypothetical protein
MACIGRRRNCSFTLSRSGPSSRSTCFTGSRRSPRCSSPVSIVASDGHTQRELRKHAGWLIAVLSWVPHDEETVKFVENFQMTEMLFESAVDARRRGCPELADDIGEMLLS